MNNKNTTSILFDELRKRPDDMMLFMTMYKGYPEFFKETCTDYYRKIFLPTLQKKIDDWNAEKPEKQPLTISREDGKFFLNVTPFLTIGSDRWPGMKISVMKFKILPGHVFGYIADGDLKNDLTQKRFALINEAIKKIPNCGTDKNKPYMDCLSDVSSLFRVWENNETFLALLKALDNFEKSPDEFCPIAKEYIERLMKLVGAVEQTFLENQH